MNSQKLIEKLLATGDKKIHSALFRANPRFTDLKFAEAIKDTCYDSWTKEPQKTRRAATALEVLSRLTTDEQIGALSFWGRGIADLTEGKLEKAVANLERAAALFDALDQPYRSAQMLVAKLYALALLGRYDEAIKCGEDALLTFEQFGDELAAGKIEMNLSNVVARRELHREAERYCLSARRRFARIGDVKWLTMAENSLANTYGELNDFRRAERFYKQSLERARAAKMFVTEAEIEASIGNLALFRGKLDLALNFLERSRQKYATLSMPHQTAIAELEIAGVYLELNLINEASAIYEVVIEQLRKLKMRSEEARARANFGRIAALKNDSRTARQQFKKAARLYLLEKNAVGAAVVKIAEAKLELKLKNYRKAFQITIETENLLRGSGNLRHQLAARYIRAEALRNSGETEQAEIELKTVFDESIKYEQSNVAQAAQIALGNSAVARNDSRRAEKHFKQAIRLIETMRSPLAAEEFRMAFLADKLAPYECLTSIYLTENKLAKAFTLTERARARALSENLNENLTAKNSSAPSNLRRKLADLREELNWFYSRLNRADEAEMKNLQTEANRREKQIADLLRQIESTAASRAALNNEPQKIGSDALKILQKSLGDRKALLEFVNLDGRLAAFVATGKKIHFQANLATADEILSLLESLQFQFGALRYGVENLGNFIGELKNRADSYLKKLHEKLFAPLADFVGGRDLVVVPVGAAHYVPFHALYDGEKYLIESREIVHAPSATVWRHLASNQRKISGKTLLFGYADERIPLVNREIEALERIFPDAEVFTDERANTAAFTENAARCDVLHLACHGQFRPENPLFSSLHLADGRITVRDISALKLKAELVALSACETGLNKIFAGEEILGLARGFLLAGAKSLLLSLWTVNDAATNRLMEIFYEQRKTGKSSAQSLRIAQKKFIERGVHPYFWSPFVLIGK